mgnify:CR=1 FL=1
MSRVNTEAITTQMIKLQPFWNWPYYHFVGNAMSKPMNPFMLEHAVPLVIDISYPKPTGLSFVNCPPEMLFRGQIAINLHSASKGITEFLPSMKVGFAIALSTMGFATLWNRADGEISPNGQTCQNVPVSSPSCVVKHTPSAGSERTSAARDGAKRLGGRIALHLGTSRVLGATSRVVLTTPRHSVYYITANVSV